MAAVDQDFTMYQAESRILRIPITDADGDPVTLTGATVRWEVYRNVEGTITTVLAKTTSDDIALYNAAGTNDGIQITLAPADTTSLATGNFTHECRVTDSSGNQDVVFIGKMTLYASQTKT